MTCIVSHLKFIVVSVFVLRGATIIDVTHFIEEDFHLRPFRVCFVIWLINKMLCNNPYLFYVERQCWILVLKVCKVICLILLNETVINY